jgi:hypothetical protein
MRPYFFGYGSLVNLQTHDYPDATPARLIGWRRIWRQTTYADRPILTVEPCAVTTIDGLIAHVPNGDWAALDKREHAYDREMVTAQVTHQLSGSPAIATYTIPETKHPAAAKPHAIYLSYLDVVVQGYLRVFGEPEAKDFFDTTTGWDAPIRNDRANPLYPRAQALTAKETAFVDTQLTQLGSLILSV